MSKILKTKSGREIVMPSPEEDAVITKAALSDPDALPLTNHDFRHLKPLRARGRPAGSANKELVSVRYDKAVIDAFRAKGEGWQTKMNDALREWLQEHS